MLPIQPTLLVAIYSNNNMQNNNFLSRDRTQSLIDSIGVKQADGQAFLEGLAKQGYTIEGYNDKPAQTEPTLTDKLKNRASSVVTDIKEQASNLSNTNNPLEAAKAVARGVLRPIGDIAGAGVDVVNAGLTAADNATGNVVSSGAKAGITAILNTPQGQEGLSKAQSGVESYNAWKTANPEVAKDLEAVVNIANIIPVGKGVGAVTEGVINTVPKVAKGVASVAGSTIDAVAPVAKGVKDVAEMAIGGVARVPSRVATNLAEKQASMDAIKTLPTKTAQSAVRDGVDIQDVKDLSTITRNPQTNKVIKAVQDFANGTSKVDPISVVGEPIVAGVKNIQKAGKIVGTKLSEASKNIGVLTKPELESGVLARLQGVRGLEGLTIKNGKLNFTGTTLESSLSKLDRNAIQEAYKEATKWGDGEKAHMFRQTLFENLGGKKKSLANITDTQEKAFEAIRSGLSDVIETKNSTYKTLSNEYRKIVQPLGELRKLMKNIDPTGSEDIANMSAGLLARRLTSAAASNPQVRQVLQNLDSALGGGGISKSVLESQDLYNILNKYYDIAPKTGFQNLVKEGVGGGDSLVGIAKETLKNVAGKSNAVRQKALEKLLVELGVTLK